MPGCGDGVSKAGQETPLIALLARPRSMWSRPNSIGVPGTMPEVSVMARRGVNDGGRVKFPPARAKFSPPVAIRKLALAALP
jgi:hypothetical protein